MSSSSMSKLAVSALLVSCASALTLKKTKVTTEEDLLAFADLYSLQQVAPVIYEAGAIVLRAPSTAIQSGSIKYAPSRDGFQAYASASGCALPLGFPRDDNVDYAFSVLYMRQAFDSFLSKGYSLDPVTCEVVEPTPVPTRPPKGELTLEDPYLGSDHLISDVGRRLKGLRSKETLDNPGCDWFPDSWEGPGNTACCAAHDACYAGNDCSAASWGYMWGACRGCNMRVVGCMSGVAAKLMVAFIE